MRRALGWLLPGQSCCGVLSGVSNAAPAWLQHAVEAAADVADARGLATRAGAQGDACPLQPSQPAVHDPGPGPGSRLLADGAWHGSHYYPAGNVTGRIDRGADGELWDALPASPAPSQHLPHQPSASGALTCCSPLTDPPSLYGLPSLHQHSASAGANAADAAAAAAASTASGSTCASPAFGMPLPLAPDLPPAHLLLAPLPHLHDAHSAAAPSLAAAASCAPASAVCGVAAFAAAEPSALMSAVQQVAQSYEFVHTASGLPWAASIPLTTLVLRLALLPLSMRQARIIRTNLAIYREAVALTDRQVAQEQEQEQARERQQQQRAEQQRGRQHAERDGAQGAGLSGPRAEPLARDHGAGDAGTGTAAAATSAPTAASPPAGSERPSASEDEPSAATALHSRLLRSQAVLANFRLLRAKCGAPHPGWLVVNPLVQIPVFVLASATLGMMCRAPWPGLSSEGALWFPDLTLPALLMATGEMPLGPAGLALPLIVYSMTMTSLRLAFGASGVAGAAAAAAAPPHQLGAPAAAASRGLADTALGAFLRALPPLLYAATTANLYFQVQMAHGVLLHWLGSAGFTLSLQLALRNPAVRAMLKIGRPVTIASSADSTAAPGATSSSSLSSSSASPSSAASAELPAELVSRVAETTDANILVIMGAQLSARHHYAGALHCFRKAVLQDPAHVRAHYSMGQVYSLTGSWPDAELSYRAAAELAAAGPERGQALYCAATALHAQGKLVEAAEAYGEADTHWAGQTVIAYGRANALAAAGRLAEAAEALAEAEARDACTSARPFRQALARLRERLGERSAAGGDGARAGGSAPPAAEAGAGAQGDATR